MSSKNTVLRPLQILGSLAVIFLSLIRSYDSKQLCVTSVSLRNTVVLQGSTATFICDDILDYQLAWLVTPVRNTARDATFFSNRKVDRGYNTVTPPRYHVEATEDRLRTRLTINGIKLEEAGNYGCYRCNRTSTVRAQLVVLASNPECSMDGYTLNGSDNDVITMSCTVLYSGNLAPVMQWTRGSDPIGSVPTSTSAEGPSTVRVTSSITLTRRHILDGGEIVCKTFFKFDRNSDQDAAVNAPDYSYLWKANVSMGNKSKDTTYNPTTQTDLITSGLTKEIVVTSGPINMSTITYQSTTEPKKQTSFVSTPHYIGDITPGASSQSDSSVMTIGILCGFIGLIVIFVNVVIGICVYNKKSNKYVTVTSPRADPNNSSTVAETNLLTSNEPEYATLTIKYNPESKDVLSSITSLIDSPSAQLPVYHESQVYEDNAIEDNAIRDIAIEDNVSATSSEGSYNYPSQGTIYLLNQLGPNGPNADRPAKPKVTDSINSDSDDETTQLKYTAEPFYPGSGDRRRGVNQMVVQQPIVVNPEQRGLTDTELRGTSGIPANSSHFPALCQPMYEYELPRNEMKPTNLNGNNVYEQIQDDDPANYQYICPQTEVKYMELV